VVGECHLDNKNEKKKQREGVLGLGELLQDVLVAAVIYI
jgi:hypothetical protein